MNIDKIIKKEDKKKLWDSNYRVKAIFNEIAKKDDLKCHFCDVGITDKENDLKIICKDMMANIVRIEGKHPNTLICCKKCKNDAYNNKEEK